MKFSFSRLLLISFLFTSLNAFCANGDAAAGPPSSAQPQVVNHYHNAAPAGGGGFWSTVGGAVWNSTCCVLGGKFASLFTLGVAATVVGALWAKVRYEGRRTRALINQRHGEALTHADANHALALGCVNDNHRKALAHSDSHHLAATEQVRTVQMGLEEVRGLTVGNGYAIRALDGRVTDEVMPKLEESIVKAGQAFTAAHGARAAAEGAQSKAEEALSAIVAGRTENNDRFSKVDKGLGDIGGRLSFFAEGFGTMATEVKGLRTSVSGLEQQSSETFAAVGAQGARVEEMATEMRGFRKNFVAAALAVGTGAYNPLTAAGGTQKADRRRKDDDADDGDDGDGISLTSRSALGLPSELADDPVSAAAAGAPSSTGLLTDG